MTSKNDTETFNLIRSDLKEISHHLMLLHSSLKKIQQAINEKVEMQEIEETISNIIRPDRFNI